MDQSHLFPDLLALRGRDVSMGEKKATGCAISVQAGDYKWDEEDEGGSKAEMKSWAHRRRTVESRKRRSCLSGLCQGHRLGSAAPGELGGTQSVVIPSPFLVPFLYHTNDCLSTSEAKIMTSSEDTTYQEGSKQGDGREEVPNVMVVKKEQQDTVPVVLTRLCRCFLCRKPKEEKKKII